MEALNRWALVREKFPNHHAGYSRAARACMDLNDYPQAESLCRQGMEKAPQAIEPLINYAEVSMRQEDFMESLNRWTLVQEKFPNHHAGYSRAARALMELHKYDEAENLCIHGIKNAPQYIDPMINYAEISMLKKDFEEALSRWTAVREKFPNHHSGYSRAAYCCLELKKYDEAERLLQNSFLACGNYISGLKLYASIPLNRYSNSMKSLKYSMKRYIDLCIKFPSESIYLNIMNIIQMMIDKKNISYLHKFINIFNKYDHIYEMYDIIFSIIFNNKTCLPKNFQHIDNKIAFIVPSSQALKYYSIIIKNFDPNMLDIIIFRNNKNDKFFIQKYTLDMYTWYYLKEQNREYKNAICDSTLAYRIHTIPKNDFYQKSNIIGLIHSMEDGMSRSRISQFSCIITSFKNQISNDSIFNCKYIDANKRQYLYNFPQKCELAYTGPYHIDERFINKNLSKSDLRKELSDILNREIPNNKPLIFILEDELCHFGQIVIGANRISQFATVIIKPLLSLESHIMNKISDNVIIFTEGWAPNLIKYSSDFVFAGFNSSTFLSSIMLGINVMPYYSKFVKQKKPDKKYVDSRPFYWMNCIPRNINKYSNARDVVQYRFYKSNKFFNILDTNNIKKSITDKIYINWYHKILPHLQKEAFGNYMLEGSANKTVKYIKQFAKDGTLGNDCSAIFLK